MRESALSRPEPLYSALTLYRWSRWLWAHRLLRLARLVWGLQLPLFSASIPPSATIGASTRLGYRGIGVVVHPETIIGRGCLISQQVTIGGRGGRPGVPTLGDGVLVGVGARVLGDISVGDGAMIGANAVVISDVPAGGVAVGVPAKLVG